MAKTAKPKENPMVVRLREAEGENILSTLASICSRWKSYQSVSDQLSDIITEKVETLSGDDAVLARAAADTLRENGRIHPNIGVTIRALIKSRKPNADDNEETSSE